MRALIQRVKNAKVTGFSLQIKRPGAWPGLHHAPIQIGGGVSGQLRCQDVSPQIARRLPNVNDEVISSIEQGACVLIGICSTDTEKDMEYIARKILSIKLYDDGDSKRWKKSIVDKQLEVLCVSQFTLYNTWKGTKPDFHKSMPAEQSKLFYEKFLKLLRDTYKPEKVKDGLFGAYMQVTIQNDGPVTFSLESPGSAPKTKDALTGTVETEVQQDER